jgi:hypothetical protein
MLQRSAAWALYEVTRNRKNVCIEPIFLVNDWSSEASKRLVHAFQDKIRVFAEDSLKQITQRIPLRGLMPLTILARPFSSLDEGANELADYASINDFQLITASTRASKAKGVLSMLPGSFVEALSDVAGLPLLIVNPKWRRTRGFGTVLYPTDLSDESYEWFMRTVEFARATHAGITLYHRVQFPLSQPFDMASRVFPELKNILFKKIRSAQIETKKWADSAQRSGVKTAVRIDSRFEQNVSDSLLACLEENPGITVIAPPVSLTLTQDRVRNLMRKSPFPVLYVPTTLRKRNRAFFSSRAA